MNTTQFPTVDLCRLTRNLLFSIFSLSFSGCASFAEGLITGATLGLIEPDLDGYDNEVSPWSINNHPDVLLGGIAQGVAQAGGATTTSPSSTSSSSTSVHQAVQSAEANNQAASDKVFGSVTLNWVKAEPNPVKGDYSGNASVLLTVNILESPTREGFVIVDFINETGTVTVATLTPFQFTAYGNLFSKEYSIIIHRSGVIRVRATVTNIRDQKDSVAETTLSVVQ